MQSYLTNCGRCHLGMRCSTRGSNPGKAGMRTMLQVGKLLRCYVLGFTLLTCSIAWSGDHVPDLQATTVDALPVRLHHLATVASGSRDESFQVDWSGDGKWLAVPDERGAVHLIDAATRERKQSLPGHRQMTVVLAFSPDGRTLATAHREIKLWSVADGLDHTLLRDGLERVTSLSWSPDGQRLAAGYTDGSWRIWNVKSGQVEHQQRVHQEWVVVGFLPNARSLVTGGNDFKLRLWDVATGTEEREFVGRASTRALAISATGQIATAAGFRRISTRTFGLPSTWRLIQTGAGFPQSVAISPDEQLVAAGHLNGVIRIWDRETGAPCGEVWGHRGSVCWLAFSPDGKNLASAALDQTTKLWELELVGR